MARLVLKSSIREVLGQRRIHKSSQSPFPGVKSFKYHFILPRLKNYQSALNIQVSVVYFSTFNIPRSARSSASDPSSTFYRHGRSIQFHLLPLYALHRGCDYVCSTFPYHHDSPLLSIDPHANMVPSATPNRRLL